MHPIAFGIGLFIGNTLGQRFVARRSWKESIAIGIIAAFIGWAGLTIIS